MPLREASLTLRRRRLKSPDTGFPSKSDPQIRHARIGDGQDGKLVGILLSGIETPNLSARLNSSLSPSGSDGGDE